VAFVGGSLVQAGGHNPLEPAQFGVPILMGPNYANFRAIADDLLIARAMRIVRREEFAGVIAELLVEQDSGGGAARAMGERARAVFEQQSGATARCVEAIASLLGAGVADTAAAVQAERGV
jgi:3-deoxy-D-manno-octulosonic-acid transferase